MIFSNLDTTKHYSLTMQYSMVYNTNNTCSIAYSDGAVTFLSGIHRGADAPSDRTKTTAHISFHKPSTSTLTPSFDENTACTLEGNGLKSQTYATLCELPDTYVETDEW